MNSAPLSLEQNQRRHPGSGGELMFYESIYSAEDFYFQSPPLLRTCVILKMEATDGRYSVALPNKVVERSARFNAFDSVIVVAQTPAVADLFKLLAHHLLFANIKVLAVLVEQQLALRVDQALAGLAMKAATAAEQAAVDRCYNFCLMRW